MRLGLVSAKGSPGVTTAAMVLAAAAGGLVVELDPAGGDVECWAGPQGEPGLIRVASALRHAAEPVGVLASEAVAVWPGVRVVLAPSSGERAESTIVAMADRLAPVLHHVDGLVVVDGGRWSRSQATARRLAGCDAAVVVVGPTLASVEHARWLVDPLVDVFGIPVIAVMVGDRPYPPGEVAPMLGVPVAGALAWDARGVRMLLGGGATRGWARSSLARSAHGVLERLGQLTEAVTAGG